MTGTWRKFKAYMDFADTASFVGTGHHILATFTDKDNKKSIMRIIPKSGITNGSTGNMSFVWLNNENPMSSDAMPIFAFFETEAIYNMVISQLSGVVIDESHLTHKTGFMIPAETYISESGDLVVILYNVTDAYAVSYQDPVTDSPDYDLIYNANNTEAVPADFKFPQLLNYIQSIYPSTVGYDGEANETLTVPNTVTTVQEHSFENTKYGTVILPNSISELGSVMFYSAEVKHVQLPSSITKISTRCFDRCMLLEEIRIPSGVTEIENGAFADNSGLQTVYMPKSVTKVGTDGFLRCTGLQTVYYTEGYEEDRDLITFEIGNDPILSAMWIYRTDPTPSTPPDTFCSKKFLASVGNAQILGKVDGEFKHIADVKTLTESTLALANTMEEVRAGEGGKLYGRFAHDSGMTVSLTEAMFDMNYIALQVGAALEGDATAFKQIEFTGEQIDADYRVHLDQEPASMGNSCGLDKVAVWFKGKGCNADDGWKVTFPTEEEIVSGDIKIPKEMQSQVAHNKWSSLFKINAEDMPSIDIPDLETKYGWDHAATQTTKHQMFDISKYAGKTLDFAIKHQNGVRNGRRFYKLRFLDSAETQIKDYDNASYTEFGTNIEVPQNAKYVRVYISGNTTMPTTDNTIQSLDVCETGVEETGIYDEICVKYFVKTPEASMIAVSANFIPAELVLLLTTKLYAGDANAPETGKPIGEITIKVPRFQLDGSLDLSMAMNSAATISLNGTALAVSDGTCEDKGIYAEIVEVAYNSTVDTGLMAIAADPEVNRVGDAPIVYGLYRDGHYSTLSNDMFEFEPALDATGCYATAGETTITYGEMTDVIEVIA